MSEEKTTADGSDRPGVDEGKRPAPDEGSGHDEPQAPAPMGMRWHCCSEVMARMAERMRTGSSPEPVDPAGQKRD